MPRPAIVTSGRKGSRERSISPPAIKSFNIRSSKYAVAKRTSRAVGGAECRKPLISRARFAGRHNQVIIAAETDRFVKHIVTTLSPFQNFHGKIRGVALLGMAVEPLRYGLTVTVFGSHGKAHPVMAKRNSTMVRKPASNTHAAPKATRRADRS